MALEVIYMYINIHINTYKRVGVHGASTNTQQQTEVPGLSR